MHNTKHTEETKLKISQSKKGCIGNRLGAKHSNETKLKLSLLRRGISTWNKGKHPDYVQKENHPMWKGGITPINKAIRNSIEYEEWRTKVFERDLYTCQHCGEIGGYLEADHIKPFYLYADLRFDVSNGRTLCKPCHKLTETYAGKAKNYMKMKGGDKYGFL